MKELYMDPKRHNGFSLVELSIVLVILGLLTGGILGGQSLIKAAELRSITAELAQWQTAVNTFRQKYFQYPGDFGDATRIWGAEATCPPTANTVMVETCDGSGDGRIAQHDDAADRPELFFFWQHLSKAGLISGTYTGSRGTGNTYKHVVGTNAPKSRFSGAGWAAESNGDHFATFHYDLDTTNAFVFGASGAGEVLYDPVLTPEEAWGIDTKIDDGKPGKGNVVAIQWGDCDNATSSTDFDKEYKLDESDVLCALYFRNAM